MEALEVLVIILSTFLAIFLVLGIILFVLLLRVTRKINDLSDKAEHFANSFGATLKNSIKGKVTPSMVAGGLFKIVRKAYKKRKSSKGDT